MNRILALSSRELRSYFLAPAGYIIIGLFLLMSGVIFIVRSFDQGQPASLRPVFEYGTWMMLFVCPAISMRTIAEERRLGTFEMLMTCPVSEAQVIAGKYLGALAFLLLMLLPTAVYLFALEMHGRPDYGEVLCGYLGLTLVGAAYLASGILASTLTNSQVVAFLLTLMFWLGLSVAAFVVPAYLPEPWSAAAFAASPDARLRDFAIGLIDTSNIVYFASLSALFLLAAIRSLETRRWR